MSSLTDVAKNTKRTVAIMVALIVFSLLLKIVTSIVGGIASALNASVPVQPSEGFGALPALQVNTLPYQHNAQIQYILNTPNGQFPQEPSFADVYQYKQTGLSLLSTDTAQTTAKAFGFTGNYTKLSSTILDWNAGDRDFVYNLQTSQYRIINRHPFKQINNDIATANQNGGLQFSKAGVTAAAAAIMHNILPTTDYDINHPTLIYLAYTSDSVQSIQPDIGTANAIKVIYRRSYEYLKVNASRTVSTDTLTLLPDNPLDGDIALTIDEDNATGTNGIVDMSYSNWPVDLSTYATYTLKTPQQAWQDVQDGAASLVFLVPSGTSPYAAYQTRTVAKFQAESITLSYFDGIKQQQYMQPVYVIQGTAILADGTNATFYFYDQAAI